MHLHFIGAGGTLMGHLALLAQQAGHRVTGSDKAVYPPMSQVLAEHGIPVITDWDLASLKPSVDLFVLGNAGLGRGHPAVEYLLSEERKFVSGAQWLGESILADRWVLAVAGTHGKTTSAAMLAWILEVAGYQPGFVIGGVPNNFDSSARLGGGRFFVVEADEYDTSYFDHQAKFLHYRARTLIIGNLEYDHADIYPDLAAIQEQFHLLLRTVPANGMVIAPANNASLDAVIERGLWSPIERFAITDEGDKTSAAGWRGEATADGFTLYRNATSIGRVQWQFQGKHNIANALAATAAACHIGVSPNIAVRALGSFSGVKRRLEQIGHWGNLWLYDDFAHHPTAIECTLKAMREQFPQARIIAFIDPSSHTMSRGDLSERFAGCTSAADLAVWCCSDNVQWQTAALAERAPSRIRINNDPTELIAEASGWVQSERAVHLVCMSNRSFGGLVRQIADACAVA